MDIPNLFKEDNDFNICKSWLCGSTGGQTYSLVDWFHDKIHPIPTGVLKEDYYNTIEDCFASLEWEDAIGYRHDFKVDGEDTDKETEKMVNRLNDYIGKLNAKIDAIKKMSPDEAKLLGALNKNREIECAIRTLLSYAVASCYIENMVSNIKDDVIEDINETADAEKWNNDDVRIAIGRVLYKRLNTEI